MATNTHVSVLTMALASALAWLLSMRVVGAVPVFTTEFQLEASHPDTAAAVLEFLDAIGVTVGILNITVSPT